MASTFAAAYVAKSKYEPAPVMPPKGTLIGIALVAALLDTMAWVSYLIGYRFDHGAVVTALASLFSVVTIVLAGVFLKERLSRNQWAGVGVVLLGILLVSLPKSENAPVSAVAGPDVLAESK
jgi:drug/metabolite transporter (DMT)-like permease